MPPPRSPVWTVSIASLAAAVMLAQLLAAKAVRDALFLSTFGVERLPYAIAAAGVVAFSSAIPVSRALARFGPVRTVPWLFGLSAGLFIGEWRWLESSPRFVAGFLYLHLAAASGLLVSGFWATLNERFDPHVARRSLARVASFASLGGVIGGLLSERVSVWFGLDATLWMLAGMSVACALLVARIGESGSALAPGVPEAPAESGVIALLRGTPYLQWMAAASLMLAVIDALLDFAIRAAADASNPSGEELVRFFGFYYTGIGLATFVLQSLSSERLLARFGIGPAMSVLPASVGAMGLTALFVPGLASAVALRGVAAVLANSVYRTGFELLYTPLPARVKRPTRTLVDVGGQRLGDVVGGGVILCVLAVLPVAALQGVTVLAIALSGALAFVLLRLQSAYREQLARNLKLGEVGLDDLDALARSVAETHVRLDRAEILAGIHVEEAGRRSLDDLDFAQTDVNRLIDALGDPRRAGAAATALRARGRAATDALIEALVSEARPDLVKLLLPGLLEPIREARVVDALLDTLVRESFEVRFRSVRAVARMSGAAPDLAPTPARVVEAIRRELANPKAAPAVDSASVAADRAESLLIADLPLQRVGRRIEHFCTLLALEAGPELMRSLLLGLHSESSAVRGTALEFLEVSLPEDIRRSLPELLGPLAERPASRSVRARRQLEAELLRLAQVRIVSEATAGRDRADE